VLPNIVLFQGQDALNNSDLWETNGTGTGTFELAATGAGAQGLTPSDITVLGGQVLFEGVDSSGHSGLWASDGTAVGTAELTSVAGASSAGLAPSDLTVFGSEALFSGIDASGQTGLWTTNGTANGTLEVVGITGAAAAGVAPTDLTVFNDEVLFTGADTAGDLGLWVTNGTAGGTQELTGIASASSTGLDPSDMTVFNNDVLFNGVDANGLSGLWVTDGTVGGTRELLAGAGGASDPAGLNPTNMTVFNGEILFTGLDASGDMGLWVSNGTAAGTHELTGITGADPSGLAPSDFTVYNGEVLFRGLDQSGQAALWITDGTVAGTQELTGIAEASTTGIGLDPSGFTVYGGVALFNGFDSSGNQELWQTNGSAAGTTEIGPVSGTESVGLSPTDLTAIAMVGPVLAAEANVSYVAGTAPVTVDAGLSVADTSAVSLSAATVSISAGFVLGDTLSVGSSQTGIVSQYNAATGVLTLFGVASLAAYQTELDSVAYASANATNSSRTITWSVNDGVNASAAMTSDVSVSRLPPVVTAGASVGYVAGATAVVLDAGLGIADAAAVNLSGANVSISAGFVQGDTLSVGSPQTGVASQYNAATGVLTLSGAASLAAYETELDSITYASANATTSSRAILWSVNDGVNASAPVTSHVSVSSAPLLGLSANNSGLDIMLQETSGQLALWQVDGAALSASSLLGTDSANWFEEGTGAFFSGDTSDILWQNTNGAIAVWQEQGTTLVSSNSVLNPGPSWHIKGTGDFYGDGHTDVLLQNDSGQAALWELNGATVSQSSFLPINPGPTWHIEGTGDFYGDGNTDVLWQNDNGTVAIWDMNGATIKQSGVVNINPGPAWHVEGTGDFYGDGKTDILLQNDNGTVSVWEMNGATISKSGVVYDPGPTWHVTGTGDFNQDGKTDITLQNDNGTVAVWNMNGATIASSGVVYNPGPAWSVTGENTMRFVQSASAGEILAATPTTPEEFVFTNSAAGVHTITGFNPVQDMIELPLAQFGSFAAVQGATFATTGGAEINLGHGSSLLLPGVNPTALHASNFALT
jgi:ELWxxDGT repeat protein